MTADNAEQQRLAEADAGDRPWRGWGPYLSERAWGTVREDYSEHGTAWDYFPHDHARSRAYRWNEDGMAGRLRRPADVLLRARAVERARPDPQGADVRARPAPEGNHGEDAKEYWWYLDSTPTHSWMRWRYHYPQRPFPYDELVADNGRRGRDEPEYELVDTGVFDDDRYWAVDRRLRQGRARPTCACAITVANRGPDAGDAARAADAVVPQHLGVGPAGPRRRARASRPTATARCVAEHRALGRLRARPATGAPTPLFCDNETNAERLWGVPGRSPYPKDGINDHVVHGAPTVNPARRRHQGARCTTCSTCRPAATREIRLRLTRRRRRRRRRRGRRRGFDAVDRRAARAEADEFFAALDPAGATADEALVLRQAHRRADVGQAVLPLRRRALARRRPGRPAAAGRRAGTGATPTGGT